MADITKVEIGDEFGSHLTRNKLEVIKIWFELIGDDNRWETSVEWMVKPSFGDPYIVTGKGRDFVMSVREGAFFSVVKDDEFSFNPVVTPPSPPGLSGPSVNQTSSSTTQNAASQAQTQKWEDDFRRNAARYGLSQSDLGRKVTLNPRKPRHYTIIGAKPRNWKMPILVRGKRGGIYKITAEKAKAGLS